MLYAAWISLLNVKWKMVQSGNPAMIDTKNYVSYAYYYEVKLI